MSDFDIPENAYLAATHAVDYYEIPDAYSIASEAVDAALPHIEAALRKQIAADIRAHKYDLDAPESPWQAYDDALEQAARIAEEGTIK